MSLIRPNTGLVPARILSIDGGGIRGLSSLLIIERIMERIQVANGDRTTPRPCDVFNLIGGSGTGGIIAILLGRLGLSAHDAVLAYKEIMKDAVNREAFDEDAIIRDLPRGEEPLTRTSTGRLELAIKEQIRAICSKQTTANARSGSAGDALYYGQSYVKTMVLATTSANVETLPTIFTSGSAPNVFSGCKIWEIARATTAAVDFFDSITIGRDNMEFIDAGFGYNNPCEILIQQAQSLFPGRTIVTTSIGTGHGDIIEIKNTSPSIIRALQRMTASSKAVHLRLNPMYRNTRTYYRFNVKNGLQDVTLSDCHESSIIAGHVGNYLNDSENLIQELVNTFQIHGFDPSL